MTERGRTALQRGPDWLSIGPSSLSWDNDTLTIRLDEVTAPIPSRLRGMVRVHPVELVDYTVALDGQGRHRWSPIAPRSRIEVAVYPPDISWSGTGYFDSNAGDGPLEDSFKSWSWSRTQKGKSTAILYDVKHRDGGDLNVAIRTDGDGVMHDFPSPPQVKLPKTAWRLPRETRCDAGHLPQVTQSLEDAPFYSRSVLSTHLLGAASTAIHESLSLDRFTSPLTQFCLPFRMPRVFKR